MNVSVVVPVYERPRLCVEAVESILSQTLPPREIIVVDDGSTDETATVLQRRFGDAVRVYSTDHRGVAAARNEGIRHAQGEWLAFLDSDDLWLPEKLERQMEFLKRPEHRHHMVCYTDEIWIRDGRRVNQRRRHRKFSGWIYEKCLPLCIISPSSVLLHRSVFETVGLFNETYPACEDYQLWLRVCSRFPVAFLPEKLIVKRAGAWHQLSKQVCLDRYRAQALHEMLASGLPSHRWEAATLEEMEKKVRIYAMGCRKRGRIDEAERMERMLESARRRVYLRGIEEDPR